LIIYFYLIVPYFITPKFSTNNPQKSFFNYTETGGFISSDLYNELYSYITTRNNITRDIKKTVIINRGIVTTVPLNDDYIHFFQDDLFKTYPYSTWTCSKTSNTDYEGAEYCILTNIYYQSSTDRYYFFQDPSKTGSDIQRDTFMTSFGPLKLHLTTDIKIIKSLNFSASLTRPILITEPPHDNYAHGFLESCGSRFWVISECQSHPSYIDPRKIQIYYTSTMLESSPQNRKNYEREFDGTYRPTRQWEDMLQSMFSIYPLLTYQSFNSTTVKFEYMLFSGVFKGRTPIWAHHYQDRPVKSYPFPTVHYRRAYLSYSEWILKNLNLKSKFELTSIQELQQKNILEPISICNQTCAIEKQKNILSNEYTGEWIVVLNRPGVGRREITNADQLITALLKTFPDHSNPYLRVWPKQYNFDENLYETARMARSIRLLIGVHGAGLSNSLFMRPGTILYEINPYGCRHLSFNFHRWAEVFNLQHALWIPTQGENGQQNEECNREGKTTVNIGEIIDEVKNLLKNELEYRNGYLKRALMIMTDMSIVDHPPSGFENVLKR
jgi:hypothetical protein